MTDPMAVAERLYAAHVPPGWPENLRDAAELVLAPAVHAFLALDAELRAEVGAAIAEVAGVER